MTGCRGHGTTSHGLWQQMRAELWIAAAAAAVLLLLASQTRDNKLGMTLTRKACQAQAFQTELQTCKRISARGTHRLVDTRSKKAQYSAGPPLVVSWNLRTGACPLPCTSKGGRFSCTSSSCVGTSSQQL